jgi:hypothetical protein
MKTPKEHINYLAHGYLLSSAIFAAAKLGIADLLWEKSEQTVDQLSKALMVDHRSLFRLLRYLVSHGIFAQNASGAFSLNPEAAYLSKQHPESIRHALLVTPGARWNALGAIQEAVIYGKPAFDILYGKTYYEYLAQNPEAEKLFNAHMTTYTQEEDRIIAPLLPIENRSVVMDIGGGEGQFLNEVLNHFSDIYGIIFDLKKVISNLKICHDRKRWEAIEGDFFKEISQTNADVYILKRVLHNWNDDDCLKILKNIHQSMKKTAKLFIIEGMIPENTSQHPSKDTDLFLMALFPGCTRSEKEWQELTKKACFQISQILTTPTFLSILELKSE